MSVNSFLSSLASSAVIRDAEKTSIQRSISTLVKKLNRHFGNTLEEHFTFGSYTRGTILTRVMDESSDIDYMVVFKDASFRPQTYLDRLRRFVEIYYSRSEIYQSNPTIVLSLNHIKFELVPAISSIFYGLQIPAKGSDFNDWIYTDPNNFNQTLTDVNQSNSSLIKPTIRLIKYWNARNNYPFASFELEQQLASRSYMFIENMFAPRQLKDYVIHAFRSLEVGWFDPQYKRNAVARAHTIIGNTEFNLMQGNERAAEHEIKRLLPLP